MEQDKDVKVILERFSSMVDVITSQLNLLFTMAVAMKNRPEINEIDVYKELDKIINCINESKKDLGLCSPCKCEKPQILN